MYMYEQQQKHSFESVEGTSLNKLCHQMLCFKQLIYEQLI